MKYDYSEMTEAGEEVRTMIETMTDSELEKISEKIKEMKHEEKIQEQQDYIKHIKNVIVPLLQKYAEKSQSVLEIEENEEEVQVQLSNEVGFDTSELDKWSKLIFAVAEHIWLDAEDGMVNIHLQYSAGKGI